jgi:hypothetical protein
VWGILTTVLCCLPLGIVSIIKANEVNRLWAQGQYQAAHESAEAAKKWAMWGALIPLIVFALIMIVSLVIGGIGAVSSSY